VSNHPSKQRKSVPTPAGAARRTPAPLPQIDKKQYKDTLRRLQIELVKLQRHIIQRQDRILVILEGRDSAGKDGTIKRIIAHLSPREVRVVALGKPSDRDLHSWYFQRYVAHLPAAQEMVLFNRSWYNRAGVERVMGFCTDEEYEEFMKAAPRFEELLVRSGTKIIKYYLDISRDEQKRRLKLRRHDPLSQWKISPIDKQAQRYWSEYSQARNEMFVRTHHASTPWTVVRADSKPIARLEIMRHLLQHLDYGGKDDKILYTNPDIIFEFDPKYIASGMIEP